MLRRLVVGLVAGAVLLLATAAAQKSLEKDFALVPVWDQLAQPTGVRFAPDGRVFVMGKGGIIYTAKSLKERQMKIAADISAVVFNNFDKGLTGLAPHPDFPNVPHVYVFYSRDGTDKSQAPLYNDLCPSGVCETWGSIARMTWDADLETLKDLADMKYEWCNAGTTHHMGDLHFDADRNLIMSSGDQTFFSNTLNFGENPPNMCPFADPSDPESGGVMQPLSDGNSAGKVAFISFGDLEAWKPGGPAPRIQNHAFGFRNPYRFAVDNTTNELFIGDVGFGDWEEINRAPTVSSGQKNVYGWPCYEGSMVTKPVENRKTKKCTRIYTGVDPTVSALFSYSHHDSFGNVPTDPDGQSAISGIAVYHGNTFADKYEGSLWFCDYTRKGFWSIVKNGTNSWDVANPRMMANELEQLVDLTQGPDGALYLSQLWAGKVWRYQAAGLELPVPYINADKKGGPVPLTVKFNSRGSFDPRGGTLQYSWDLDGSGTFQGPATPEATFTYTAAGPVTVSLRITSSLGPVNTISQQVYPGSGLTGAIELSVQDAGFDIGDPVTFKASIKDETGAEVPKDNYKWTIQIAHCYPGPPCRPLDVACHQHLVNDYIGVDTATFPAPDHEYPSWLTFNLQVSHPTADQYFETFTAKAVPRNVNAKITTDPPGLQVILNLWPFRTPYTMGVLSKGDLALDVADLQMIDRQGYKFVGWSQGGPARQVIKPRDDVVYTAKFEPIEIGKYPDGQGPSPPLNALAKPHYKKCDVVWDAPATADPGNPTTGYIVYHREVKFGAELPPFSSSLVPVTSRTWTIDVDVASECQFQIAAVTDRGESSFKSAIASALSLHLPPLGTTDCPDTQCKYKTILMDDWNHPQAPKNLRGLWQEGEFLKRFEALNGKLYVQAKNGDTYWYSILSDANVQCLDGTQFTHLTFKMTAPEGSDFFVGMDSKDDACKEFVPKRTTSAAQWTPEGKFTGTEQTVVIPITEITNNVKGLTSAFFNKFSAPDVNFVFDDLALVNRCNNPPDDPSGCRKLIVDRFIKPETNELGLWSGSEGMQLLLANGQARIKATQMAHYFATVLAGQTCRDLTKYNAISFNLKQEGGGKQWPDLQLQFRDEKCGKADFSKSKTVRLDNYVKEDGSVVVPLTAFSGADLKHAHAISLIYWPLNVQYFLKDIEFVCAGKKASAPTPDPKDPNAPKESVIAAQESLDPTSTCTPTRLDGFSRRGINDLNLWTGGSGVNIAVEQGKDTTQVTRKPHASRGFFAELLAEEGRCLDLSKFENLQVTTGGSQLGESRVVLQTRLPGCKLRDPEGNFALPLASKVNNGIANIPLREFKGADLSRVHGVVFDNLPEGAPVTFKNLALGCPA